MYLHYEWLTSYTVFGNDGEIGTVSDTYFDEENWTIRYLVVKTGATFLSEKRFISPLLIEKLDHQEEVIRVNISKDDAEKSPDPGDEPVSRKYEQDFNTYYRLTPYWVGNGVWGSTSIADDIPPGTEPVVHDSQQSEENQFVHQAKKVIGYELSVKDDTFGKVDNFLIDEKTFEIKYFIVDTHRWLPGGKKVLISTKWIEEVGLNSSKLTVDVTRDQVEKAPEYLKDLEFTDKREQELWIHYNKK